MDKQFSQESKHLIRFLHQEEQSLKPICIAFYRKQHSLVRMKFHWVNVRL